MSTQADAQTQRYSGLLSQFMLADNDLAREAALMAADQLSRQSLLDDGSSDDLLHLHQRAQGQLAAAWQAAVPGSPQAHALAALAAGQSLSMLLALLLPQQLDAQQKLAERQRQHDKLRAVATLAAGVAHDFNNLLGTIAGQAELCAAQLAPDSAAQAHLGTILQAGDRAALLVGQLLSFASERAPMMALVDLGLLLQQALPLLAASLPAGVHLQGLPDGTPACHVLADAGQLEQVLLNLVKNAGHAMRQQGGVVQLRLEAMAAPMGSPPAQRWLCLQVVDQGEGISADVLPRVFDPFFTTKAPGDGTGLGLSAAYGIVRQHGGLLQARSGDGQTVFSLCLPDAGSGR